MSDSCETPQGREYANENVNDDPPSASALTAADAIEVFDEEGKKHTFKSIYNRPDLPKRVLVVFVRHFYCCSCVHYTKWLTEHATPEKLQKLNTAIIIVGHGDVKQIEMYRQETGWQYPIYTEPSEKIYSTLGMIKTWKDGPPNSYMPHSYAYAAYWSITLAFWRFMQGYPVFSSGAPNLQGGEFMFEGEGEDRVVTWCHRMKHSRDHADIDEISEVLGLNKVQV